MDWYLLMAIGAFAALWFKLEKLDNKLDGIEALLVNLPDEIREGPTDLDAL